MSLKNAWLRTRFNIREALGEGERGAALLARLGGWGEGLVRSDSRVCIEGYPRSANTYAVAAFRVSQNDFDSHLGRHSHLAGNVRRALRLKVPVLVLIREPRDAISSLKVFSPHLRLEQCLKAYVRFYETLRPLKEHFVTAEFQEVTDKFDAVLARVSSHYGMDLAPLGSRPETLNRCFRLVEEMDRRVNKKDTTTDRKSVV